MSQHPMEQFHQLIRRVLSEGVRQSNRTGVDTFYVAGAMLEFNLARDGFPAITTKRLAFRSAVGELLGFFRGYQNAADFAELGCPVWHQNANETREWLASSYRKQHNDLGRIYGAQWTDWKDIRIERLPRATQMVSRHGYTRIGRTDEGHWILSRGINQLEQALELLLTQPTSRRIVISGWRPDEFDKMALPPCHTEYDFVANPQSRSLDLCVHMRSFDLGLGFNVALGALFLEIMARLAGFKAGKLVMFIANAHVYANHVEGLREMIEREHFPQPSLVLSEAIAPVTALREVPGVFARINPDDLRLEGYLHHPAIKLPMAA